jgi:hypothetical protein
LNKSPLDVGFKVGGLIDQNLEAFKDEKVNCSNLKPK